MTDCKALDKKGRCCGRKPFFYKRRTSSGSPNGPFLWCDRCGAYFDPESGEEIRQARSPRPINEDRPRVIYSPRTGWRMEWHRDCLICGRPFDTQRATDYTCCERCQDDYSAACGSSTAGWRADP